LTRRSGICRDEIESFASITCRTTSYGWETSIGTSSLGPSQRPHPLDKRQAGMAQLLSSISPFLVRGRKFPQSQQSNRAHNPRTRRNKRRCQSHLPCSSQPAIAVTNGNHVMRLCLYLPQPTVVPRKERWRELSKSNQPRPPTFGGPRKEEALRSRSPPRPPPPTSPMSN